MRKGGGWMRVRNQITERANIKILPTTNGLSLIGRNDNSVGKVYSHSLNGVTSRKNPSNSIEAPQCGGLVFGP